MPIQERARVIFELELYLKYLKCVPEDAVMAKACTIILTFL